MAKKFWEDTYSSVLAKRILEVTVGGAGAETRDVKVVAWVVVTSIAASTVGNAEMTMTRRW